MTDPQFAMLLEKAERRHADALFRALERGSTERAMLAAGALAPLLAGEDLPKIEALLAAEDPSRALVLVRMSGYGPAGPLVVKQAKRLLAIPACEKPALGILRAMRLRGATDAVLAHLDSDEADIEASIRALGWMWARPLGAGRPPREEERTRLKILLLAHGLAMQAPSEEAFEAMLLIMTREELDDFLKKHAADAFQGRDEIVAAAMQKSFDPARGQVVHQAMLESPDGHLVMSILLSSPHELNVWKLLRDERKSVGDARLCDYAAARLEGSAVPSSEEERDKLLLKWRSREPQ